MVKLGPDVENGRTDAYSGYLSSGQITGFSMMHESGTGGAPKYGVVNQMPVKGIVDNPLVDLGQNRSTSDVSQVGYYKSALASGIDIEVSATEHAGFYQYKFPSGTNSIVVDVSHVLPSFRGLGWGQGYAGGQITLKDNGYEGHGIYNNGWNLAPNWTIYFCGEFDQQNTGKKTFTGSDTTLSSYGNAPTTNGTNRQGAVFTFDQSSITSRVGISFISTTKACQNLQSEIPKGTTLQSLVSRAKNNWNTNVLSTVTTTETNTTLLTQLYSYMYGMMVSGPKNLIRVSIELTLKLDYPFQPDRREPSVAIIRAQL